MPFALKLRPILRTCTIRNAIQTVYLLPSLIHLESYSKFTVSNCSIFENALILLMLHSPKYFRTWKFPPFLWLEFLDPKLRQFFDRKFWTWIWDIFDLKFWTRFWDIFWLGNFRHFHPWILNPNLRHFSTWNFEPEIETFFDLNLEALPPTLYLWTCSTFDGRVDQPSQIIASEHLYNLASCH